MTHILENAYVKSLAYATALTAISLSLSVNALASSMSDKSVRAQDAVSSTPLPEITPPADGKAFLDIRVKNIDTSAGNLIIELFSSEQSFTVKSAAGRMVIKRPSNSEQVRFASLAEGRYAYRVYQDTNRDGLLNTSAEPYIAQGRSFVEVRAQSWDHANMLLPIGRTIRTSTFPEDTPDDTQDAVEPAAKVALNDTAFSRTGELFALVAGR